MNAMLSSLGQPTDPGRCLRCHLLGPPIVAWNETVLEFPRRLVRALLYRLASDPEPVSRSHLRLLFWPDVPDTVARRNLSHLLTHLIRALPEPEMLVRTTDEVWLEPRRSWCDVLELKRAGFDVATDPLHLRYAASLYRGPFLDGFDLPACPEFEQWCLVERNSLEHRYLGVLECLVERCASEGRVTQAIRYARQYLETDSLSETMHRRLIQLLAATGDRHLALQQFEHCSSILESDLGVHPLPETQAVYQAVLGGHLRFPDPPSPLHPARLPDGDVPMLGREEELGTLEAAFRALEAQHGQVVLISGESGIGKSRLVQEFAKRHQRSARLLYGCGYAGEQAIPYQPILGILRAVLELGEERTERPLPGFVEPIWLSEASRLLPEMQAIYPDLPSPLRLEPASARTRLFDALCHLILAYAMTRGPVLLCLDDLQWMDSTTKAWLVHIGRFLTPGGCPLLILGTYRTEEAGEVLHLRHALARAGVLAELKLAGLQEPAVLALLRHLIDQRSGDEMLARRLHRATGGNPFYLIETVHKLIEEGRLEEYFQEAAHLPLPQTVREAVEARLQRLSPVARQVLEAGAVLGESFGLDLLRLTAGRSHGETISAVEELVARILVVEAPQEYRFIHEIVRQHVEESLGPVRRQLLHRRAGRAYQRVNPDAFPALAYHFGWGGDLPRALHYHELAARQAQSLFAWRAAEFHQGRMLELLAEIDPGCDRPEFVRQRGDILADRAQVRYLQGRLAERDADLAALRDLGGARRDDQVRLQAILNRLRYLNQDGEYALATAVAEEGLALLEASPAVFGGSEQASAARSRLLAQTGLAYYFLGRPREALGVLEEAWRLCEAKTDPQACGRVLHILGYVYLHLGDYRRSLECQQQAYIYHAEAGDSNRVAWDLIDVGAVHRNRGDLAQARHFLEEGLELSSRVGSQHARAYGLAQLGSLDLCQGDYAAAAAHYQQAIEIQQVAYSEHIMAAAEAGLGLALYHLGDYGQSRHWLERALQHAQPTGHRRRAAKTLIQLGILDAVEGRLSLARQHLEEGLETAQDCQSGECVAAGLAAMARLERLAGDPITALETAAKAVDRSRQCGFPCLVMWGEIEAGLAYLALGDPSSALEHTQHAVGVAPQASQEWIGREEAYRAYALALRALSQGEAVDQYERRARSAVQAKAKLIADPLQRHRYLSKSLQP